MRLKEITAARLSRQVRYMLIRSTSCMLWKDSEYGNFDDSYDTDNDEILDCLKGQVEDLDDEEFC